MSAVTLVQPVISLRQKFFLLISVAYLLSLVVGGAVDRFAAVLPSSLSGILSSFLIREILEGSILAILLLILLERFVLMSIRRLRSRVDAHAAAFDLSLAPTQVQGDELDQLEIHFETWARELAATKRDVNLTTSASRLASLSPSLLHNVGNVMTNINVLSALMIDRLRESKLSALMKSASLLREHDADLCAFLNADPRGKQLPNFICQVADCLEQEQLDLLEQLRSMSLGIEHVNRIIEADCEPKIAQNRLQPTSVESLVRDAIEILKASLERHQIAASLDFEPMPMVQMDRHQVLQILVNLLANARDAVMGLESARRRIEVKITTEPLGYFSVSVSDRGDGIDKIQAAKIFKYGYTTKPDGNGVGLYYSATVAKELNGSLTVHSDGQFSNCQPSGDQNWGATFKLVLPMTVPLPVLGVAREVDAAIRQEVGS